MVDYGKLEDCALKLKGKKIPTRAELFKQQLDDRKACADALKKKKKEKAAARGLILKDETSDDEDLLSEPSDNDDVAALATTQTKTEKTYDSSGDTDDTDGDEGPASSKAARPKSRGKAQAKRGPSNPFQAGTGKSANTKKQKGDPDDDQPRGYSDFKIDVTLPASYHLGIMVFYIT